MQIAPAARRVASLIAAGDLSGVAHKLRCALGLRRSVPFPRWQRCALAWAPEALPDSSPAPWPMTMLAVSHNLALEGASISLLDLLKGLRTEYAPLEVTVVSYRDGPLREDYLDAGISVRVIESGLAEMTSIAKLVERVELLVGLIRERSASVVIANTLLAFPAVLAAAKAGVPCLWIPRESEPWRDYFSFLPNSVAEHALTAMTLANDVVFVASATREVWRDFESCSRFHVIHNALLPARYAGRGDSSLRANSRSAMGLDPHDVMLLSVGTLCERKNQGELLRAVAALPAFDGGIRIRVLLLGDVGDAYGAKLYQYGKRFERHGASGVEVCFEPATTDVRSYLAAADVFVLCSKLESHPRVILEAMAFGLPVVATRVFGVQEQVVEGQGAWLYEPGQCEQLSGLLAPLVAKRTLREQAGRASAGRFASLESFDSMVRRYGQLLFGSAVRSLGTAPGADSP